MLNNLATTRQNFVRKFYKLMESLIVKFLVMKPAVSSIALNTCVILPVNTLHHNDVIVNKILTKALRQKKHYWARKVIFEFSDKTWSLSHLIFCMCK